MIAYFFRFLKDSEPTNWLGFALAKDKDDMLWQIDQHGDPYSCEIQTTSNFSFCGQWDENEEKYTGHETSEECPASADPDGWRKPPWVLRRLEELRARRPKPERFGYDKNALF
jgi:hypothetical protein